MEATKVFSIKQEQSIADELGWSRVAGSGAAPCAPGDVRSDEWIAECKTHVKPGEDVIFMLNHWQKIQEEGVSTHKYPVLFVDEGSQDLDRTWVICFAHSISPDEYQPFPFPKIVKTNIKFNQQELKVDLGSREAEINYLRRAVYKLTWDNRKVLLMPFRTFQEVYDQ